MIMIRNKIRVYLSSTTYHWWNLRSYNWKKTIRREFKKFKFKKVTFIDPLLFKSEDPSVCALDIKDINSCDYTIVYLDKITIGTMMELSYCIHNKKNYYVISMNEKVLKHPWIVSMCKNRVYNTFKECVTDIYAEYCTKIEKKKKYFKHEKRNQRRSI